MTYKPIDMEALICEMLPIDALCAPLPSGFGMPLAFVTRTGGEQIEPDLDAHAISVDVYAETWREANEKARACVEAVRLSATSGRIRFATANVPYDNTDPSRPDVARVSFTARVIERTN